jgi:hypothetical protein
MAIAQFGSKQHRFISRMETKEARAEGWKFNLKDNEKGLVVNNTSGTLHYEDHKRMLDDVVMVRQYMPTVFDTLIDAPGVQASVSLYETLVGYQNMNEFNAQTSMNGSNRQTNQSDYKYEWVPQPIYHCDFHIPWRQSGFGYKQGDGASEASMQVRRERDEALILGNSDIIVNVNGVDAQMYGLTNAPGVLLQPGTLTNWANPDNSDSVYKEANTMIASLYAQKKGAQVANSGYFIVASDVYPQLNLDYSTQKSGLTNMQRIEAIPQVRGVLTSEFLPDGAVLFVEALPQTLRIPTSVDVTVAPWQLSHQMEDPKFTVFAASTLQVRQDRNGNTGIVYATKA